jgi:hypothetical protein
MDVPDPTDSADPADRADPADLQDDVGVSRDVFFARRHDRTLPEDSECMTRIRQTIEGLKRRHDVRPRGGSFRPKNGGRGRQGRGFDRGAGTWARERAVGKRPLKSLKDVDPTRDLAAACNKLSASNFDRICERVLEVVRCDPEPLLDALFVLGAGSGSFGELYVRMFRRIDDAMPGAVRGAVSRAATAFSESGATVMEYVDLNPDTDYDQFCSVTKARNLRISTLAMLLRLGVKKAAQEAMAAFDEHMRAGANPEDVLPVVQIDLVVDGLATVVAWCPDTHARAHDMATCALRGTVNCARTKFKIMDVLEASKPKARHGGGPAHTSRRLTAPVRAA